jgi:cysteine desulfuration protein SufE
MAATGTLPAPLQDVVDAFRSAPPSLRTELLLEFSRRVPPLPAALRDDRSRLEQVHECMTPFFLATEVTADATVRLHFDAPEESPTTRGFAGILHRGLDGQPLQAVAAVPDDFYEALGLAEVISPLRLRGMAAILARLKRQLREAGAAR